MTKIVVGNDKLFIFSNELGKQAKTMHTHEHTQQNKLICFYG
jgi:hypothetical protein